MQLSVGRIWHGFQGGTPKTCTGVNQVDVPPSRMACPTGAYVVQIGVTLSKHRRNLEGWAFFIFPSSLVKRIWGNSPRCAGSN